MSNGGWGHGGAATGFFWESLGSMEQDYFGILSFQPKIFRLKLLIIKVSNPKGTAIMFHRQNRQKYFVQNGRRLEWTKELDPLFLDIFGWSRNVHFALCAPPFLNMKRETPKNGVVTIMLTKRVFGVKNM